jgi:glyoxylase-like metal-dependent hydrolase (beta-lactamase superfamily II)
MPKPTYQQYNPAHLALHERAFPHKVLEGVWIWSFFLEKSEMDGNGYLIQTSEHEAFIVDPPCEGPEVLDAFATLLSPQAVLLTNRNHERASDLFRRHFGIPIYAHEADAANLQVAPDRTFRDGATLPGNWQAIHLPSQKSPGETAFYHLEKQILILGDALLAVPYQQLSLPDAVSADRQEAVQGLRRLLKLDVKTLLPTHGDPVLTNAAGLLKDTLQ